MDERLQSIYNLVLYGEMNVARAAWQALKFNNATPTPEEVEQANKELDDLRKEQKAKDERPA